MMPLYRVKFTVDGLPFHVRRDKILVIREMKNYAPDQINPHTGQPYAEGERDAVSGVAWREAPEAEIVTVVVLEGGPVMVDESLREAVEIWDAAL